MAEFVQDAAAALLLPPAAAAPVGLALLLELSLAHPASPALAASTAIAAMAATLICLIRALLTLTPKIKRIIIPNDWARAPPPPPALLRVPARTRSPSGTLPFRSRCATGQVLTRPKCHPLHGGEQLSVERRGRWL